MDLDNEAGTDTALDGTWSFPPAELALLSNDVHVWCVSLDQPASSLQQLAQTLSEDERTRAERFYFEQDRKRFIVGRGLLRTLLGRYLDIEPDRLQFCYGSRGKPVLAETINGGTLCFNLSHSQGLALYAFTYNRQIGIDLECVRPMPEAEQIVKRFFSTREHSAFCALPSSQKHEAFFHCWTRKEAYLKATGDGLAQSLDQIEVSLTPGEPAKLLSIKGDPHQASRWSLQELKPASGYVAALALEGSGGRLACWQWRCD
jgi:4'-phosphopantetheinyl transferase